MVGFELRQSGRGFSFRFVGNGLLAGPAKFKCETYCGKRNGGRARPAVTIAGGLFALCFIPALRGLYWRDKVGFYPAGHLARLVERCLVLISFTTTFPAFWVMVTRIWIELGWGSDNGLRVLGFLVGLFVLGALWFCARRLRISIPFFSLLLLGFSHTIVVWGDSMRAWGWGIFWTVIAFGCIWRVVELPTRWNVIGAALAAIASVHSTYYNWVWYCLPPLHGLAPSWPCAIGNVGNGAHWCWVSVWWLPFR